MNDDGQLDLIWSRLEWVEVVVIWETELCRVVVPQHLADSCHGLSSLNHDVERNRAPETGRICLIRSVVVRTVLTGGTENAA